MSGPTDVEILAEAVEVHGLALVAAMLEVDPLRVRAWLDTSSPPAWALHQLAQEEDAIDRAADDRIWPDRSED